MNDVYCGLLSQVDKSWLRDLFIAHCGIGIIFVTIRTQRNMLLYDTLSTKINQTYLCRVNSWAPTIARIFVLKELYELSSKRKGWELPI